MTYTPLFCPSSLTTQQKQEWSEGCYSIRDPEERKLCNKFSDCKTCPDHGTCNNAGELLCHTGYIWIKDECKEDQKVSRCAEEILYVCFLYFIFIQRFEKKLRVIKGEYECGESNDYHVTFQEFEAAAREYTYQYYSDIEFIAVLIKLK